MRSPRASLLLISALCCAACGQDASSLATPWALSDAPPARATLETSCAQWASARCERLVACQLLDRHGNENSSRRYATLQVCEARETLGCTLAEARFEVDVWASCAQQITTQSCDTVAEDHLYESWPRCARDSLREVGQPCQDERDCASNICNTQSNLCAAPWGARLGEACQQDRTCMRGACEALKCAADGSQICVAPCVDTHKVSESGSCDSSINAEDAMFACPPGEECFQRNDMGRGGCLPYALEGEQCSSSPYGADPPCLWPARCIAPTGDGPPRCEL